MALALYRKYRPRTFAEVIGQEHVTEPLSQALRSGRLNHAYLFSGPRGCGKTSSARILARSLNCEQGPTPEPCGQCGSCKSLATDGAGSIDVIEIDAASHGGVDDARELRERAFFAPASSRYKIYVIDEAHMVSSAGFNALLKLVEEPPEYVKFIFATTEPEKVLGTIKSRTHHYPFRLIPPGVLRPYLEQLCEAEGVTVDPAVFPLVVRAGGGSARDSLSVLDQLIAGAGPDGVSYARAVALLGVTDAALIDEMCDALAAGDGAAAFATVDRVAEAGHDPRRFASDLLERLRDLIILQQVPDAVAKGLIDGPADQIERMTAQAARLGAATLSRCADIVHNGLVEMRGTTAPRLLLELISARMLLPGADDSTGGLLQRLERLERRLTLAGGDAPLAAADSAPPAQPQAVRTAPVPAPSQAPAPTPAAQPATAPVAAARPAAGTPVAADAGTPARRVPPEAVLPDPATPDPEPRAPAGSGDPGDLDAAAIRRVWGDVVSMINRSNKKIAALVRDAVVRDLDGSTLVLTMKSPVLAQMVNGNAQVLTDALYEQLGGRWQIRCEVAGADRGGVSPARTLRPSGPAGGGPSSGGPAGGGPSNGGPSNGNFGSGPVNGARDGGNPGGGAVGRSAPGPAASGPVGRPPAGGGSAAATASSRAAGPGVGAPPTDGGAADDDWPEAARPGGGTSSSPTATGPTGSGPGVPGPTGSGPGVPGPTGSGPTSSGSTGSGPGGPGTTGSGAAGSSLQKSSPTGSGPSVPGAPGAPGPAAGGFAASAPVGSGLAAARAAAAGRGVRTAGATVRDADRARGADPGRSAAGVKTADRDWAGEPPYDPEFDGPVRSTAGYEGFDPGDEPLDDVVDEKTARQSSEQQALQLLQQAFGAERIGEVDAK